MLRSLIAKLLLMVFGVVFAIVILEGGMQLFSSFLPENVQRARNLAATDHMGMPHPYVGHLHTPNTRLIIPNLDFSATHHTDAHGFRNSWPWPDTAEIVTIGDSLTFGYGVADDQSWPALIGQDLPHLRVVNLGLIGAGPEQYTRVYETFGKLLKPKLVLVGLFPDNDFWDTELFDRWLQSGVGGSYMVWREFGRPSSPGLTPRNVIIKTKNFLKKHSVMYGLAFHVRNVVRSWRSQEPKTLQLTEHSRLQLWPSRSQTRRESSTPNRPEFQSVIKALSRLKSEAAKDGTQVLVVIQPGKEEIYMPLLGEAVPDPHASLHSALDDLGLPYLDLVPAFRQRAAAKEQLFFENDGHPNRAGHTLIAQEILAYLKRTASQEGQEGPYGWLDANLDAKCLYFQERS